MKLVIFTFLLLILNCDIIKGQTFTLTELINLTKNNIDDFDTYVIKKGYIFLETDNNENMKGNAYAYNQNSTSKTADKFITYYTEYYGELNKNVTYQTDKSSEYLIIKNQLNPNGFKFKVAKTIKKGATMLEYQNGKLTITLSSIQQENLYGKLVTVYEISVTSEQ